MHLHTLTSRDELAPSGTEIDENSCKNSFSWFRLCPIDFALWALIVLLVSLVFWRIYAHRQVAAGVVSETPLTGQIPTRSRHKGYQRLTLPYPSRNKFPSEPSPAYDEDYGYEHKGKCDPDNPNTPMDPYHVVSNIDNSLISKDANFTGASVPVPAKEQKKSGKIGLGLCISMVERKSPIPEYTENVAEDEQNQLLTPPPPPAYLRNPRWDM